MTSKILTVSNLNSSSVSTDNAEIISTFNPPLSLNIDTQFNFKSGFIDVVGLGNSGQDVFTIDNPIDANITISYYEQLLTLNQDATDGPYELRALNTTKNPPVPLKVGDTLDKGLEFQNIHYILCLFTLKQGINQPLPLFDSLDNFKSIQILKNNINIIIPPGTYSSDSIVELINIKLQGINKGLEFYQKTGLSDNHDAGINNYISYESLVKKFTQYQVGPTTAFPNGAYQQYLGFVPLDSANNQLLFEPGPNRLTYYYKQEFQAVPLVNETAKVMIGTSLFNLQNIDDLLSFEYTHNPYFNTAKTQIVELQELRIESDIQTPPIIHWRVRRGGINLIKLEPTNFWNDILGFDDSILLNITQEVLSTPNVPAGILQLTTLIDQMLITGLNSFNNSTTIPFIGTADYDANFDNTSLTNYPITGTDTKTFPSIAVNTTVSLNATSAVNFSDLNNGGHFLLSIEIGQRVNNFISNNVTQNIISIMSREYLNDGYISVFDGGNPLLLTSNTVISYIKVNIIDPLTGKNAVNLGNRNTFYFELG